MKHLRVFTILLCLTLSITILSACGDKEPNANSNPSSASGGSMQSENAQNSDAPEEDAPSIELADMGWSIDDITYFFYADGTLEVTDGTDSVFGGYEWDGQAGLITLDGFIVELLLDGEGDLYMEGEDGEYYRGMEYMKTARKFICVLLAALLSAMLLGGCGQDSGDSEYDIFEGYSTEETEEDTWSYYGC